MTRLEKINTADKAIQNMQINNDLAFFTHLLPDKMSYFLTLTYFNEIENSEFQYYLSELRERVLSTITWCKQSKLNETDWQKNYTLSICKRDISNALYCTQKAVEYYLGSNRLLLEDEG
jgi:hypothetical protein